jgi:GT2 family glycosyltransferase
MRSANMWRCWIRTDWWEPRKLELSVQALREGADIVFHDLYLARSQTQRFFWSRAHTRGVRTPAYDDLLERGNALTNSSVVVRRALLTDVGGFSEGHSLIGWEDYDAWLRVARRTDRFARLPQTLGYYRIGGGNVSSPERTLRYLERFRQLYWPAEGSATRGTRLPAWYHYGLGRAHHHLGNSVGALDHMRQALRGRLPTAKYAKAFGTAVIAAGRLMTARQQRQ